LRKQFLPLYKKQAKKHKHPKKNKYPAPKGWHGFCLAVAVIFPLQKPCQKGDGELKY